MPDLRTVEVNWEGGHRFRGGAPGGPTTLIDADAELAPGPMLNLLIAAAACSGTDVVSILQKMQVKLTRLHTTVTGLRRDEEPRRYVTLNLAFELAGEGLDESKARRAVDLSVTKYCSVLQSLNPDIPITYDVKIVAG
jgi:putative redox protein